MPKKFIIKDEDGKKFEITEETADEEVENKATDEEAETEVKDDEGLTPEEIVILKELAKHSADLIKLLEVEKDEHEAVSDDEMENAEELDDSDESENVEEIIETKSNDSKKSVGSIERKKEKVVDSIDAEEDIANAWAKRFQNSYKGE